MTESPEPLVRRYPILHRLRRVDSWWAFASLRAEGAIDPREADEALAALIALDRSWNDHPSADTHAALRKLLAESADLPLGAAFEQHAARQRASLPAQLAAALAEVDGQLARYITDRAPAPLLAAEQSWIDIARATDLDALPVPMRLSLVCDAAQLHQAALAAEHTRERLQSLIGILDVARELFRNFQAHPPMCQLHLDPRFQTVTARFAIALRTRFEVEHDRRDLDEAQQVQSGLLEMTRPASPEWPMHLAECGKTLGDYGEEGIDDALLAFDEAAALEPVGSAERISNLTLAGSALVAQFAARPQTSQIDQAITLLRVATTEARGRDVEAPSRVLAEALLRRALASKAEGDAIEAVRVLGVFDSQHKSGNAVLPERLLQALTPILPSPLAGDVIAAALDAMATFTTPEDATAAAAHMARLAQLLYTYDARRNLPYVLDRVILLLEGARTLDGRTADAAARDNQLALFYSKRFALNGDARDLGQAVAAAVRASTNSSIDVAARRLFTNTLGTLLVRRYEVAGAPTDLSQAIAAFTYAIPAAADERRALLPGQLAGLLGNLGSALRMRADRRRDPGDLDRALEVLADAEKEVREARGVDVAMALNNLAGGYHDRWRRQRNETDLDSAIAKWTDAGKAYEGDRRPGNLGEVLERVGEEPDVAAALERWAREALTEPIADLIHLNRGSALLNRFEQSHRPQDLDEALSQLQAAVPAMEAHSPSRPLGANRIAEALHQRFLRDGQAEDRAASADWSRRAVAWAGGASADTRFRVAWDWGSRAVAVMAWPDAAAAYGEALTSIRQLLETSLLLRDRETLMEQASGLPTRAAYAMSNAGDLRGAVAALEYGRGLLLAEAVGVLDAQLEARAGGEHADLLAEYRAATTRWGVLADRIETPSPDADPVEWHEIDDAQRDLLEIRSRLQSEPALAAAFAPPAYDEIAAIATTPLVYLVPGQDAGVAILVEAASPEPVLIALPECGEKTIGRETRAFVSAYERAAEDEAGWAAALDGLTRWLGTAMAPVRASLQGRRAIFIPTGALVFLPLHAAWTDDRSTPTGRRYALDDGVISYVPSALSMAAARRRPSAAATASSLLGVSNPRPSAEPALIDAEAEVARAAALFATTRILNETDATVETASALLAEYSVVHYACHAFTAPHAPRQSGIVHAHDRMLTVADLVHVDLEHAKLAVLSACETGVPGVEAPDEMIGLATALFGAGFDGVVASLWSILDASALVVMTRFYEYWRGVEEPPRDPAEALVLAQRWVRDTTNDNKQRHWDALAAQGLLPAVTHDAITREIGARRAEGRNFAAPDDWAPFFFTGVW